MLLLEVLVPVKRDRAGLATLYDGARKLRQDAVCASAVEALAAARGNPQCDPLRPGGHPPLGRYRLLRRAPAPPGSEKEYGAELLVFEAEKGPALEAESFGRLGLLVYSGSSGADGGRRSPAGRRQRRPHPRRGRRRSGSRGSGAGLLRARRHGAGPGCRHGFLGIAVGQER